MKRALFFLLIAIFIALVLQPNLSMKSPSEEVRVPTLTESKPITNDDVSQTSSESNLKIGIDAGKGGSDYGYMGNNAIAEKEINLEIAKNVGEKLSAAGYDVVYTRVDDTISSEDENAENADRLARMQAENVDVLLSFQSSNSNESSMKGFTIFTRPDSRNTSLANKIGEELVKINFSTFMGVDTDHYANFSIFANREVPTLMIDLGYLSNPDDYARLTDTEYQEKIGQAITQAFLKAVE